MSDLGDCLYPDYSPSWKAWVGKNTTPFQRNTKWCEMVVFIPPRLFRDEYIVDVGLCKNRFWNVNGFMFKSSRWVVWKRSFLWEIPKENHKGIQTHHTPWTMCSDFVYKNLRTKTVGKNYQNTYWQWSSSLHIEHRQIPGFVIAETIKGTHLVAHYISGEN